MQPCGVAGPPTDLHLRSPYNTEEITRTQLLRSNTFHWLPIIETHGAARPAAGLPLQFSARVTAFNIQPFAPWRLQGAPLPSTIAEQCCPQGPFPPPCRHSLWRQGDRQGRVALPWPVCTSLTGVRAVGNGLAFGVLETSRSWTHLVPCHGGRFRPDPWPSDFHNLLRGSHCSSRLTLFPPHHLGVPCLWHLTKGCWHCYWTFLRTRGRSVQKQRRRPLKTWPPLSSRHSL